MNALTSMSDEQLAAAYINGNNRAFDELLSRSQDKIFSYIIYVVKEDELANDLFQETFLKIITKMQSGRYKESGKFLCWAIRVAHNVIIDYFRAAKGNRFIEPGKDNDLSNIDGDAVMGINRENELHNEEVLEDVKRLMNALPEPQREVVFMRYFQELSFKEIAELTNVSINTSLGRMRYALLNLRKMSREHSMDLAIEL